MEQWSIGVMGKNVRCNGAVEQNQLRILDCGLQIEISDVPHS